MADRDGETADLLVREDSLFFFRRRAHVHINPQVEAARAFQFIPDQQRNLAGGAAVHQNLGRRDHQGVGDGVIGDGDSFQPLGGVNEQRLAHQNAQGRSSLSFGLRRLRIRIRARSLDLVGSLIGWRRRRRLADPDPGLRRWRTATPSETKSPEASGWSSFRNSPKCGSGSTCLLPRSADLS